MTALQSSHHDCSNNIGHISGYLVLLHNTFEEHIYILCNIIVVGI